MTDLVPVTLSVRQLAAMENLVATGHKVRFQGVVNREPLDLLSADEMEDLVRRLKEAIDGA